MRYFIYRTESISLPNFGTDRDIFMKITLHKKPPIEFYKITFRYNTSINILHLSIYEEL